MLYVVINCDMLSFLLKPDCIFFMRVQKRDPPPISQPLEGITISERWGEILHKSTIFF